MTAETLKPFILPTSNNLHNPNSKKSGRHIWILIGLSAALLTLSVSVAAVYITVWQAVKIDTLEIEIQSLRNDFHDMKRKYGFNDLDDLDELEKEYSKSDNSNGISDDDDDDDDEDYFDSYEQSGNYLPNRFDEFESDDEDESYDEDDNDEEYSSEDNSKKVRIIRAIDSMNPETKVEIKAEEKKDMKHAAHKRRQQGYYHRQSHPYNTNFHHKRRPKVKTMLLQRQGKFYTNGNNLAAAHYYMNSTVPGNNRHHITHMKVPHDGDIYIGAAHPWARRFDAHNNFDIEQGLLKVKENGVYYVYSQVLYENNFDKNGYRIYHNDYPFLQCALTIPNNMPKSNTCYTSGVIYLQSGDLLHMRDLFKGRNVALKSAKTFFGIVKLASD